MLSTQEFKKLGDRCDRGKEWIETQPHAWGSQDPRVKRAIDLWHRLSFEWVEEARERKLFTNILDHSQAWYNMKLSEAVDRWKRTPKNKRGPDPRTLPANSFF